ncbi:hypothetical protein ACGH52_26425 [Streptomyces sp. BBFR25]|uniref:hypothetical protein n=1 Tax=Streptomyces sp. BBFR25 TaxID=3372855 RepID=UPI0037DBFAC4
MKNRDLMRIAQRVDRREVCLRSRFITPIAQITAWDPESLDFSAAYVGLLHAEAESALEEMVKGILKNSREKTEKHSVHPVLLNCVAYFSAQLKNGVGDLGLIPPRSALRKDSASLMQAWDNLGARVYFDNLIKGNNGAGLKYVEKLLHPLGISVTPKKFKSLSSAGVTEVFALGGEDYTKLQELVKLRGLAMHVSSREFADGVQAYTPLSISKSGREAAEFTLSLGKRLARSAL